MKTRWILISSLLWSQISLAQTPQHRACHAVLALNGLSEILQEQSATTLAPGSINASPVLRFLRAVHAPLFRYGTNGIEPYVIRSITRNSQNDWVELRLNPSCRWSDGQPIRSRDVAEGLKRVALSRSSPIPGQFLIQGSQGVHDNKGPPSDLAIKLLDEHTLSFPSDLPLDLIRATSSQVHFSPVPTHVPPDKRHLVTSGPFYPVDFEDDHILIRKNPYYCEADKIHLASANLLIRPAQTTALSRQQLTQGKYTVHYNSADSTSLLSVPHIKKRYALTEFPAAHIYYLLLNAPSPAISQALAKAINRTMLAKAIANQKNVTVADSLLPPSAFSEAVSYRDPSENYRVNDSILALKKLGYDQDNRLNVVLYTRAGHLRNERAAAAILAMLARLPLTVDVRNIDSTQHYYQTINHPRWHQDTVEISLTNWGAAYPDPQYFLDYLARFASPHSPESERFHALIKQANQEDDSQTRQALLRQSTEILSREHNIIPLWRAPRQVLIHRDFTRAMRSPFPFAQELKPSSDCS